MSDDWSALRWCLLGGGLLHVRKIEGEGGRALVEHRYPGRDGAEHEDLGRLPQRYTLDVVFFGATYHTEFDYLLKMRDQGTPVYFEHPHHDSIQVRVASVRETTSTEGAQYIEAQVEVVESSLTTAGFTVGAGGVAGANASVNSATSSATASVGAL